MIFRRSGVHARGLGYECTVVEEATYTKEYNPDPEWPVGPAATLRETSWVEEVYTSPKSAGARLARDYMTSAGVRIVPTWPHRGSKLQQHAWLATTVFASALVVVFAWHLGLGRDPLGSIRRI